MTDKENLDEAKRQAALMLGVLAPLMEQIAVTQAVLTAMVTTHPDPDMVRQRAESLLMQAQSALATRETSPLPGERLPLLLPESVNTALDYIFRPALHLDPD